KAEGIALLTTVYKYLNLVESDYFGLELEPYPKCGFTVWLDSQKPIAKQVKNTKNVVFKLGVKFFPEDSSQLQEEITSRYQFALQVRQDLLAGRLVASEMSSSLMAACLLQADVSDYEEQRSSQQLREVQYLPNQEVLANRILDYHRQFAGLSPAEADVQLLEIARRQDTYGLRLHQAYDKEGASINLAVGYSGVSVFQNTTKINTFNWAKIRKLSFKRKYFLVKFHPDIEGNYQDTLEFSMKGRDACKAFWKGCVESHAFFRLQDPPRPKPKSVLFSRGSSFRYRLSGRTQKQVSMYVRDHGSRRVQFERRSTKMRSSQSHRAIPAHPPQLTAEPPKQSSSSCASPLLGGDAAELPGRVGRQQAREAAQPSGAPGIRLRKRGPPTRPPRRRPGYWKPADAAADIVPRSAEQDSVPGRSVQKTNPPIPQQWHHLLWQFSHADELMCPFEAFGPHPSRLILSPMLLFIVGQHAPLLTGAATEPAAAARVEEEEEARKKRCPADKAYFIAKEICTTERTHIKDLEVITVWFSSFLGQESPMSRELSSKLFSSFQPLCDFHRTFLKEVETRLTLWEGKSNAHLKGDHGKIGDIMLKNMQLLKNLHFILQRYIQRASRHETKRPSETRAEGGGQSNVCHLTNRTDVHLFTEARLSAVIDLLLSSSIDVSCDMPPSPPPTPPIILLLGGLQDTLLHLENVQKLMELQRDLTDMEDLAMPGREFIREGCLHKLTRKGLQQRMFFLIIESAEIFYKLFEVGGRHVEALKQFALYHLRITASEREFSIPCSFTLSTPQKHVVVAANSPEEMDKWVEDVTLAASLPPPTPPLREKPVAPTPPPPDSSDDQEDSAEDEAASPRSPHGASSERLSVHQQTSSTVQVCCHRQTSVSLLDISRAAENQLSGYLLRKFKNNSGWQKLWVVFTNFCLFFYKTHQDNFPLASLPVLGYSITLPSESDGILKDYVFKLQFKSHIYFFRAESEYTFERWMEVIRSATSSSARTRLLSRKDSHFT
uniref:FERM, RhoGEF and pleckstrin domain protein 2 n=1 Tax=Petromyzon marinus TaxID=7757 RepID=S4RV70_PETMA